MPKSERVSCQKVHQHPPFARYKATRLSLPLFGAPLSSSGFTLSTGLSTHIVTWSPLSTHLLDLFITMPGFVQQRAQTLYDKVFNDHVVDEKEDGTVLIFIGTLYTLYLISLF
jgi:hypothetical protein